MINSTNYFNLLHDAMSLLKGDYIPAPAYWNDDPGVSHARTYCEDCALKHFEQTMEHDPENLRDYEDVCDACYVNVQFTLTPMGLKPCWIPTTEESRHRQKRMPSILQALDCLGSEKSYRTEIVSILEAYTAANVLSEIDYL